MSQPEETLPLEWTTQVWHEAERKLDLFATAILKPGQDLYVELRGYSPEGIPKRSKVLGPDNPDGLRLSTIGTIILFLIKPHNYTTPTAEIYAPEPPTLLRREITSTRQSAHERIAARAKLPELFSEAGATTEQIEKWLDEIRGRKPTE